MPASAIGPADLDWAVAVLAQRREALVALAPVFWRPAADAAARHREFLELLLTEGGARGFRTDNAVLVAAPRGEQWLIDDMHVPGSDWGSADGAMLWNAFSEVSAGEPVRFVCPTYEKDRAAFARSVGLVVAESWWLIELPHGPGGGEAGVHVDVAGTECLTVAAPPVYDPGGPVLYIPATLDDAPAVLAAAANHASGLGCPAVVVNQIAGDTAVAQALADAGFRRHCEYFSGTVRPV